MILRFNKQNELTDYISSEDAICHFTRKEVAIENILNELFLKFGSFNQTNDPQEYKRKMPPASGWEWGEDALEKLEEVAKLFGKIFNSSGFISFCQNCYGSEELTEHGFLKSRMWSQYGDSQKGICLVFSKRLFVEQVKQQLHKTHIIHFDNVSYKDPYDNRLSDHLSVDGEALSGVEPEKLARYHIDKKHKEIFFQKQPDYQDECECRIVVVQRDISIVSDIFIDISSCLKLIILGDKFPKVYLPTIKALSDKINVPYRKLHWENHSYVLLAWDK